MSRKNPQKTPESGFPLPEYVASNVDNVDRFFLSLSPDPSQAIAVAWGGRERCVAGYCVDRPELHLMAVEFVAAGQGRLRINGNEHLLRCGSAFFYGPGVPHRIESDQDQPMTKYFVNYSGRLAKKMVEASRVGDGGPVTVSAPGQIGNIFDQMIYEGKRGDTDTTHEICATYLQLLFLKLSEHTIGPQPVESRPMKTFEMSKACIDEYFVTLTRVAEVAKRVGVSESYLSKLFKRYEGMSPYAYLMQLRLNHAAQLLTTTSMSIGQVARHLNFSDQFQFSRTFKKRYGVPPISFRTNSQPVRSRSQRRTPTTDKE